MSATQATANANNDVDNNNNIQNSSTIHKEYTKEINV